MGARNIWRENHSTAADAGALIRAYVNPAPSNRARLDAAGLSQWFAEEVQPHERSPAGGYCGAVFPSLPTSMTWCRNRMAASFAPRTQAASATPRRFSSRRRAHAALDFFRHRRVVAIDAVANLGELSVLEDRPDASEALNKQQELGLLAVAVRQLPDRCREVLTLRLLYAMSHKEIAADLASPSTRLRRNCERHAPLRRFLAQRGLP